MKTKFIAPNGVEVEGVVLYSSPIARDSKSFVNSIWWNSLCSKSSCKITSCNGTWWWG